MSISRRPEGCSKGSLQQGWNSLRKPRWSSLGMLSITHDKGDSRSDGSDDLKFRQGKQQLLHIKKCKNAEKKTPNSLFQERENTVHLEHGKFVSFFPAEQLLLRYMQPPALWPSTAAIWKISQGQVHDFFLPTNTIAHINKEQPHSYLSPAPRTQRDGSSPLCSLLPSCPYMTHRKEIAIQVSSVPLIPSMFVAWEHL